MSDRQDEIHYLYTKGATRAARELSFKTRMAIADHAERERFRVSEARRNGDERGPDLLDMPVKWRVR